MPDIKASIIYTYIGVLMICSIHIIVSDITQRPCNVFMMIILYIYIYIYIYSRYILGTFRVCFWSTTGVTTTGGKTTGVREIRIHCM